MTGRLQQQIAGLNVQWPGKLFDHRDRRIAFAALDLADIGAVYASPVGIILLAPAFAFAKLTNIFAEARAYIHDRLKTRLSPMNLQTISDITVDCPRFRSTGHVTYQ